ncbi:MAG: hypothetical protein R3326_08770 [Gemmatimonadota bacterium]|nr:hypothetical protein [Gemmatimonadota bacterium]
MNETHDVTLAHDRLQIGPHDSVAFQRTLRIPDDGGTYPLPPGLGAFPVRRVADYADAVPESWRERGGVFLPMYQREAMWIAFDCPWWRAAAVQVGVGKVDAITGRRWRERLNKTPSRQNYLVVPDQPWLDGINAGEGFIRQFVAMPLGQGYTVEGQVTGREEHGGVQLRVVEPVPGAFPDEPPERRADLLMSCDLSVHEASPSMGLGAGGRMRQKIYPDPHGWETWDESNAHRVFVHIANSQTWRAITGEAPPATPVSAETYTAYGLPWFDLYDEDADDLPASERLAKVKSVKAIDQEKDAGADPADAPVDVPGEQVVKLGGAKVADGDW